MARYTFRELVIDSRTGLNPRQNFVLGTGSNYYITIKDIHDGKIVITDKTDRVDDAAIAIINRRSRIKNGDILFTSIGRIGETAIVTNKDDTWDVNESVFVFTVDTKLITQEFFCTLFQSKSVQEQLTRDSSGSTFKSIKMNQLEKMVFNIPSLEEQKRIANILGETNKLIALRKEQLAKLDQLVKSRFIELFGEVETNVKGFAMKRMDECCKFIGGAQPDKSHFEYEKTDDNIRLIQIRDYKSDRFITYIPKSLARKTCTALDIMIGRYGPPIFQILGGIEGAYNVALMKAVLSVEFNTEYFRYFLKSEKLLHYLESFSQRTAGQDGIQIDKLNAYPCFVPPMELQEQFATFVKQTDKSKLAIQQSLDKLETLKKSLMQEYFG